ncbi:MAG: hypothetical protein ACLFPJ_02170 [Candidatus Woesearchaeota archaeon]
MGIGTLIIFIATILVAAVAAGVLISTSGVLQQRALITGQEARQKITNAVEVVSVVAYGDKVEESLNNIEIMIRLDAGSDPIQMKGLDLSFIGPEQHAGAKLTHPTLNYELYDEYSFSSDTFYDNVSSVVITNTSAIDLWDLNEDNKVETLSFKTIDDLTYLIVNFTDNDVDHAKINLGYNLEDLSQSRIIELYDEPIIGQDGFYYGYFHGYLNITENSTIDLTKSENYLELSKHHMGKCNFDTLPTEEFFCFEVLHGNNDVVLGSGEVLLLKFKLKDDNKLFIGQDFSFIITSEHGRMSRIQAKTPNTIQTRRITLWPVG